MRSASGAWMVVLACLLASEGMAVAAEFTVGGDPACDFTSLQDAIDAARDNPGLDSIHVATDGDFTGEILKIRDEALQIVGGYAFCSDTVQTVPSTPVGQIQIVQNSNVYLYNLEITGVPGPGIFYRSTGTLGLYAVWIHNNLADTGGGILFAPIAGGGLLTLNSGTTISGNVARYSGGGIALFGDATLVAVNQPGEAPIYIAQNVAAQNGGGIYLEGPATANIGATVDLNVAVNGGGIAVGTDVTDWDAQTRTTINLFATDPANPPTIYGNHASGLGGGVYITPVLNHDGATIGAELCADNVAIDMNTASDGAAIYIDHHLDGSGVIHGGDAVFNARATCGGTPPPSDVVQTGCAAGVACNEMKGNIAQQPDGTPTGGAIVQVNEGGFLRLGRIAIRENSGGSAVRALSPDQTFVALENCLLVDNSLSREIVTMYGDPGSGTLDIHDCTIANNPLQASIYAIFAELRNFTLVDSIIDEAGSSALGFFGGVQSTSTVQYVISTDVTTLPGTGVTAGSPTFVDAAHGNYRLTIDSLGVDYGTASRGDLDLDGNARVVDLGSIANVFGPVDVGAYELQTADPCLSSDVIFCGNFD